MKLWFWIFGWFLCILTMVVNRYIVMVKPLRYLTFIKRRPVIRKTHLNYKSFKKIKIHEFAISLARGKSLQTKKKKFSVFFSQFAAKKEIISTLLAWLSSVCRERRLFL